MKHKILVLDVYPEVKYRISKDLNGGYGTGNDYGDSWFSKLLKLFVKNSINFPPLYSVQVCGELVALGHELEFKKNISSNDINNYDLIIMPSSIVCHETEIEFVKKLSKINKVLVIGPFGSANPNNYLKNGAAVLKGEPENFFHKINLTKFIEDFKIELIENSKIVPLDDFEIPGWETVFKDYTPVMKFLGKGPAINLYASKGCPYSCFHYCTYPTQQGRVVRRRSVDNLIGEIEYWSKNYNIKNFLFRDPVFSINNKLTLEVCKKIKEAGLKIKFGIETHLNNLSEDLAKELYDCGLRYIEVGIESVTDKVIKASKRFSIEKEKEITLIKSIEKIGIKIKTMFIYGLPLDDLKTCQDSLDFAKKINASYSQYNIFTPYPGTPIYKEYEEKIISNKYEDFSQTNLVFKHDKLSKKDLSNMISKSYRDYYLRTDYFFKIFKNIFKKLSVTS